MGAPEIDVQTVNEQRKNKQPHVLLDVREADELVTASVTGAVHIPMKEVAQRIGEIPSDVPVYVMCHHGGRSERVANYLQQQGRTNVHNVRGGIDDWATKIDSSVARY